MNLLLNDERTVRSQ